ncbi:MAG: glycosyltransferase family 1 protein [Oligoflexia bacterium]|nr:glycosyltransferase family 1 protein [Oligoflexia bacterium]
MKVAHFLGTIRPEHDGVTRVMYQLMPHYSKSIDYHYVSPILPQKPLDNMHLVPSIPFPLSTDYRLSTITHEWISGVFKDKKPDCVHIHTPCTLGLAAKKYAVKNKIPYVITFHTHFPSYLKHYHVGILEPLIWKYLLKLQNQVFATITPSTAIKKELEEKGFKKLIFIPHGVNTQDFSPENLDPEWKKTIQAENKFVLLFVSRLVEEKNLKVLSQIPSLIKNKDKIKFVIVGDGPSRKKLETLMPDAFFAGYLTGEELYKTYASSDIFIFPSMTETFGNVTAEALASGLISICANKGAAGDLIKNNVNGFLVSGLNAAEFANKIDYLIEHPDDLRKIKANCRESVLKFTWQQIAQKYEALYYTMAQKLPSYDVSPSTL